MMLAPIFLVGCPRSGTTLLQRMLDAHRDVAIAPETFFVRRFMSRRKHYGKLGKESHLEKLLADLVATPEFAEMGLDRESFHARVRPARTDDFEFGDVFAHWLEAFRELRGKKLVGEKTPNHLLFMRELEATFPAARFVHIVRDPRAVAESWRRVPWTNGSLAKDAEVWRRYLETARNKPPRQARLYEIRYERLVTATEAELRGLCAFLEIEFDPAMLRFHEQAPIGVNVEREPWKGDVLNSASDDGVLRWQDKLTPQEIRSIESVVYFEMRRAGYVPRTPLPQLLPAAIKARLTRRRGAKDSASR